MPCRPTPTDHCCWVGGQVCPWFDASPGIVFRCSLRSELGDWGRVHRDPRYRRDVAVYFRRVGVADCGDWRPTTENRCVSCGWDGSEGGEGGGGVVGVDVGGG